MSGKIVLVSDDIDFFEYIIPKLDIRESDLIYKLNFSEVPEKIHLLKSSLLIINCEKSFEQSLELIDMCKEMPIIVFGYNENEEFVTQAYKLGILAYITLSTSDNMLNALIKSALELSTALQTNYFYRNILVDKGIISSNNEVYLDCNNILDNQLNVIKQMNTPAVIMAISSGEKDDFTAKNNKMETIILNHVRKTDILINYAINKYFLIMHNITLNQALNIWKKIESVYAEPIFAGIIDITNQTRQQLVHAVLNKLHEEINKCSAFSVTHNINLGNNFKSFRKEFKKKIEQVVSPVFFHIKQKYENQIYGISISVGYGDEYSALYLKADAAQAVLKISSPGFSTVNIDIEYNYNKESKELQTLCPKRINMEPEKLEEGFLQDIIEEFIIEFRNEIEMLRGDE